MKLNPDCIRDILLFVESVTNISDSCSFDAETVSKHFPKYDFDEIFYHLRQCELNGFFYNPSHAWGYQTYSVDDLTPEAHEFLANIRNDTFFNKVKNIAKELGLNSLNDLTQIALNASLLIIKSYFHLP